MKHFLTSVCLLLALSASAQDRQPVQNQNVQPRQSWTPGMNRTRTQQNQQQNQQQNPQQNPQQNQMPNRSGQFSPAEYWRQQKEFFTEKACLTEKEANDFFPIYNELQQKKRELNRNIRLMSREEGQTEEQARKSLDAIAEANIKIANLEKEYLTKFEKVLPATKILKIQNAEEQFNSQILKDIQQSRSRQFTQPNQQQQQGQFNQQQRPWNQQQGQWNQQQGQWNQQQGPWNQQQGQWNQQGWNQRQGQWNQQQQNQQEGTRINNNRLIQRTEQEEKKE